MWGHFLSNPIPSQKFSNLKIILEDLSISSGRELHIFNSTTLTWGFTAVQKLCWAPKKLEREPSWMCAFEIQRKHLVYSCAAVLWSAHRRQTKGMNTSINLFHESCCFFINKLQKQCRYHTKICLLVKSALSYLFGYYSGKNCRSLVCLVMSTWVCICGCHVAMPFALEIHHKSQPTKFMWLD